ncbi:Protein TolB [Lachnellula suecica]|uniref:Protein TolB n=1 Tax=Lachnellula suecica TaxID=602035 RepID=A0A8T9CGP4_9HELO|nr:Protein TolB [Lachnellula suecica]
MRTSFIAFLSLFLFGLAAESSSCPYAERKAKRNACPATSQDREARHVQSRASPPAPGKKGVFFHNRIAPGASSLYIANADGTNERLLLGNNTWSPDGEVRLISPLFSQIVEAALLRESSNHWLVFTSERNGDGNSDIWRVRSDGSGLEEVAAIPAVETAGSMSPNGSLVAYSGTLNNGKSNIWITNLTTGASWNVTNSTEVAGNSSLPDGHFRPAWSPDGEFIVFSSDKDTLWRGHNGSSGWEHTQETSIYTIRPDGTGYRKVANNSGYSLGSPKFSPDGSRIIYYEMSVENTFQARISFHADDVTNQIASVDYATGGDRLVHTSGDGVKIFPQYVTSDTIGYLRKGSGDPGTTQGLNYTSTAVGGNSTSDLSYSFVDGSFRSPSWSPNGTLVVYQVTTTDPIRPINKVLYSWQEDWEYRFLDVFPKLSNQGVIAYTNQQTGDASASVITMNPDGSNSQVAFVDLSNTTIVPEVSAVDGGFDAFQPDWSPDGKWISSGWGNTFQAHNKGPSAVVIYPSRSNNSVNGSAYTIVSNSSVLNSGFPSFSPDSKLLVYREFSLDGPLGLRILNLTDGSVRALMWGWDNTPGWSPDGSLIVFTRRTSLPNDGVYEDNYDVCTIRPDGSDYTVLTTSGANDAHAVWTNAGEILYSTGEFGFQDEASLYDDQFQPYAQIMKIAADGSNKTALTNGFWEDAMPLYVPNAAWS